MPKSVSDTGNSYRVAVYVFITFDHANGHNKHQKYYKDSLVKCQ